jgi:hypothetical protein
LTWIQVGKERDDADRLLQENKGVQDFEKFATLEKVANGKPWGQTMGGKEEKWTGFSGVVKGGE